MPAGRVIPLDEGTGEASGWRLVPSDPGWPEWEQWAGYQAALADEREPDDPELYEDPGNAPPSGLDDAQLAALLAGAREITPARFAAGLVLRGAQDSHGERL
jgi:hypothetical protein